MFGLFLFVSLQRKRYEARLHLGRSTLPLAAAGTQELSLWDYMRERKLSQALRCSVENFGELDYIDGRADGAVRHVRIFPLYAIRVFIMSSV